MTKKNQKQQNHRQQTAQVKQLLLQLQAEYMPEIDVLNIGKLSETERREQMLGFIERNIRQMDDGNVAEKLTAAAQIFEICSKTSQDNIKEVNIELRKIIAQNPTLRKVLAIELLQREIWEMTYQKITRANPACILNNTSMVSRLPAALRVSVEWLRETSRVAADVRHFVKDTIHVLFPEIEGKLSFLNSNYIRFILQYPHRHIAASLLKGAAHELTTNLHDADEKVKGLLKAMEKEGEAYEMGLAETEIYIMRIMAILSTAINEHHLLALCDNEKEGSR